MKNTRPGRPVQCRCVGDLPRVTCFKPEGVAPSRLKDVVVTLDELEALRLADKLGHYHAEAAEFMKISRQTFGRILQSARRKVAEAIVEGKSICIEGGNITAHDGSGPASDPGVCVCLHCSYRSAHHSGTPCRTERCPHCGRPLVREGRCTSLR
ncbi:DUF134 domain-containing protein [Chlorobium sp. N1]|uniref:DUF134 domain-containing protein n=1 Tax=Chlorobium sp. N1 TaxID=2491138 RepID=UPI00103B34D2|nr:DUF134 domain-containing protein [Chlorobium sp. N1]TCD47451.1 DUF134 domain-containing protein [Chlorobium sp. N1]